MLAQLLLVGPGTGGAYRGQPGDERVQIGAGSEREARAILQERPAQALERGVALLLDAPGAIHGVVGAPDDMKLVEGDPGVGQMLGTAFDEGGRHVDADGLDLCRGGAAAFDLAGELTERLGAAPLGDRQDAPLQRIGRQADVVVATGAAGLIDRQLPHRRQVGAAQGGSIWRTLPSGSLTRGTRTSRKQLCWKKFRCR